ncbi:spns1 [Symbiodinium necroappetens]|uniref:Spns1 protein n=1 Tax=Symbiodinium necroappetens TaxID=1628268 RepID=A0A812JJC6_9DINO|nr:spns1 [Symbiodinium necroappetens]
MEAALPIPEVEEEGSYELQLPAQTSRTAWLRQLATQRRFMPSICQCCS